ncbi:MAG: MBL fold metallo-hydrolase [Chloroflexi bacterium]|nr:MAG: MBL fold metallo-hydrolase [Chloroflexota bacterium]
MSQRLIVLGAGTALPDRDRDNTFLVWDSPAGSYLIDCGGRAYQQLLRANVDPHRLRGMILTHNHPDHIYGVPAFLFHLWLAGYQGTFDVYANPSTLAMARKLCAALELEAHGHMCATNWHELAETPQRRAVETDAYTIFTTPVRHSRPTLALRFVDHQRQRSIVYSADTEPCPELEQLAQGAHTLVHEATVSDPAQRHTHTTPREAGEIAARSGVQRLVLIHYSAAYTMPEALALAEVKASGFGGEVRLARELEEYSV